MLDAIFAIPGMMLILGALVVPLLPPFVRNYYMLALDPDGSTFHPQTHLIN